MRITALFRPLALVALIWPIAVLAQKHPNIELGFNAEKLYQFSELDSVNLYNGNLILQMPIGQTYQVNALQYRFTLVYNSKVWDHETFIPAADQPGGGQTFTPAYANMRSNAGAGWRLSFGRLIEPGKGLTWYNKDGLWNYEDASGAEHSFGGEGRFPLHPDQANAAPVLLTLDQSAIRMVRRSSTVRDLEFPSGETHRFEKTRGWWYLRKISDRFGNYVTFSTCWLNSTDRREAEWHISDSQGRKHRVVFSYRASTQTSVDQGQHVERIELDTAASGSTGSTPVCGTEEDSGKSIYRLNVVDSPVDWACGNTVPPDWPAPERADFPLLNSITLPDQTSFTFSYHDSSQSGCEQGALQTMTLPTKGSITYDYTLMALPESFCWPSKHGNISPAVVKKTVTSPFEAMPAVTDYRYTLAPKTSYDRALACMDCNGGDQCQAPTPGTPLPPVPQDLHRWTRTSVVSPAVDNKRVRTDHYFYTWNTTFVADALNPQPDTNDPAQFILGFGQALTTGAPETPALLLTTNVDVQSSWLPNPANTADRVFLSTRVYGNCTDAECASGTLLRSTYRKLSQFFVEHDPLSHSRTWLYPDEATLTAYDGPILTDGTGACSGGTCWTMVKNSEPDGVHKFGKAVTTTTLPDGGGFEVFTKYHQWTSSEIGDTTRKWLLNIHDWTKRTEGNDTVVTDHCFDGDGYLTGVRSRISSSDVDKADVLTLFSGSNGNVEWEKTGLANDEAESQPCQGSSMLLHYLNRYTYSNGVFVKAQACVPSQSGACSPVLTAQHINAHRVGVPTHSYDPAGVATKYDYDEAGRLWKVHSTLVTGQTYERTNEFTYTSANTELPVPARASVHELVSNATGAVLAETTYEFDHLGRVAVVERSMPDNMKSTVETTYDAMGRTRKVTQPFDPTVGIKPSTTTKYDALGRPVLVTGPDGTSTQFEYAGDHVVRRTTAVATSETGATSTARVTEKYDAQRRLRSVIENAVNTSATVTTGGASTTTYSYDLGGRLTGVAITGGGTTQSRSFVYDKRGFLMSETHPESGTTTYSEHDARGHAGKQVKGGRTVVLDYDDAGRLASVGETVSGATQPLKSFEFATANGSDGDLKQGKLVTAKRYNRLASAGLIVVTDTYEYKATGGRVSSKTTKIESVTNNVATTIQQFAVSPTGYDGLGAPTGVNMPTCAANGCVVTGGISALNYTRDRGYLKEVEGFGTLTYHPNAMVHQVVHNSVPASTDTYNSTNGLARPSSISFSGGTLCLPPAPPTISAPTSVCPSSIGNQASVAASNATHTWRVVSGGTLTSSATGNSVTFSAAASGTVVLAVKATSNGCSSAESTRTVSINPLATATITAASPVQITRGSSSTLSVSLTGTAPWVITWSDGVTETTSAAQHTRSVTPSVTTTYTITSLSSAGCSSGAQSGSRTVTVSPPSPASVTATTVAASSRQVRIQWSSVSSVDQYVVERASVRGGTPIWTSTVPATTLEITDTVPASSSPVAYIYYVRAVDSVGTQSARGAHDFATIATVLYADSVVQKRVTGIKAAHIVELRGAIDALRFAYGLAAAFAGQVAPSGPIRAADFTSLAAALNPVRTAHGLGSFQYTGTGVLPVTVGGVAIAEHIEQLRRAVE